MNFEWVVDRYTNVEPVTIREVAEAPLTPPTKLNTPLFSNLEHQLQVVQIGESFYHIFTSLLS